MIQAILFDFGNVLAFFDHGRAIQRYAPRSRMPASEMYEAIYDGDLEHVFERGELTGTEFLRRLIDLIGYEGNPEELRADFVDIFSPNPPVLDLIPRLADRCRLVLASNTNVLHSGHYREVFAETLKHFHALGMSFEAGVRKPRREYYGYCLRLANCQPSEALFVDDIAGNVDGAAAAGIPGIQYRPDMDLAAELRHHGIEI